jgi:DNA polymerase I-like protein with 3'-5' exonuclease and polymerase domains
MNRQPVTLDTHPHAGPDGQRRAALTDPAVRGRVRLIPCLGDPAEVIAPRRAIGNPSGSAWRTEAPGVLAAMMREAALWLAEPESASTAAAPEAYRYRADEIAAEQDPVNTWISDETEPADPGERANVLYEAFREWCRRQGITVGLVPNRTKWGRELTARGYPMTRDRAGKTRPLRLRGPSGSIMPITPPTVAAFMPSAPPASPAAGPNRSQDPQPAGPSASGSPAGGTEHVHSGDQLVTGSVETVHGQNPLVRKGSSDSVYSVHSSDTSLAHTHAHAPAHTHARGALTVKRSVLVTPGTPPLAGNVGEPEPPVTLSKAEAAKIRRAAATVAARDAAIAAAAGELIELPASVDRAGTITILEKNDLGATLAGIIVRAGALTVDVETSGYPVGHDQHELRTVQLGDDQLAVVLDASDPAQCEIASMALTAAPRLHAHSATADLGPLVAAGILETHAWNRMYDTVIPAKLADPTSTDNGDSLKQLAASVLRATAVSPAANKARAELFKAGKWLTDTELTTPVERSGWAQVDRRCSTMVVYAASDVLDTAALVGRLPVLPEAIVERERSVQRITARVTHHGLRLDREHVAAKLAEHTAAMTDAAARVNALGIDNPGSDQQVGAALIAAGARLPMTPTGRPSVAAAALEALRGTQGHAGALVAAVLDYRHHETVCSTFLEPYRRLVEHGDGRARPTVYTLGTDTGRMSCVRPNLQQLPREGGVRACITADPGYTLISADFAGVELRVAAALSGDANLAGMLARGDDPHWMIAREVFGPEATKADRYVAKRVVFGRLYGGGVPTLARQAGVSESVASSAVDVLDAMTPQLAAWSRAIRDAVKRGQTQFPSYSGRVIWLPAEYPHKGPNYCIQGSARELLADALIRWDQTEWHGGVVLPVHDEIVATVPEVDAERATAALVAAMSSNLGGVEIRAEASQPSVSWRDAV